MNEMVKIKENQHGERVKAIWLLVHMAQYYMVLYDPIFNPHSNSDNFDKYLNLIIV